MVILLLLIYNIAADCVPYGTRLTLGQYYSTLRNPMDQMRITFNVQGYCTSLYIVIDNKIYKPDISLLNMTDIFKSEQTKIVYETYIYTVRAGALIEGQTYTYALYDDKVTVFKQHFTLPHSKSAYTRLLVFGDMDSNWVKNTSKPTFDWLEEQVQQEEYYDAILFQGDMAYDLETNNCAYGEFWLRSISHFTSRYPFMATAGNHEFGLNKQFDFYKNNFKNPWIVERDSTVWNDFYTLRFSNVTIIEWDPYWWVYNAADEDLQIYQLSLMRTELQNIDRTIYPWVIVFNHYPIYCSDMTDKQCQNNPTVLAKYEDLFQEFKVDLYLSGHYHAYQRNKPFYRGHVAKFQSSDSQHVIRNNSSPVYIVEGSAGNDYKMIDIVPPEQEFTISQGVGIGIGTIKLNSTHCTHLYFFEHILLPSKQVFDYMWIIKQQEISQPRSNVFIFVYVTSIVIAIILLSVGLYQLRKKSIDKKLISDVTV